MRRVRVWVVMVMTGAGLTACGEAGLDTRTFDLNYLRTWEAERLITPYVFTDREGAPGAFQVAGSAITVRETPDNLEKIERMLAEFDRPRPTVMLHFQIIRADGAADTDPAIADVERELRRLFRFDGYELVAETRVGGIQGTGIRQAARGGGEEFLIESGVTEVRDRGESPTVTLDVRLSTAEVPQALTTQVTIPTGHAVVLGTAQTQEEGALILVVRAEISAAGSVPSGAAPADGRTAPTEDSAADG